MDLTTLTNMTTETITKKVTQKQFEQVIEKICDLGWDYDRMSSSGKQVYDESLPSWGLNPNDCHRTN